MAPSLANELHQVLDTALSALDGAVASCEDLENEKSALQTKMSEQEKIYLEKVAEVHTRSLNEDKINQVLDRLEQLNLMPGEWRPKVANQLKSNANNALSLILQLTEAQLVAHSEGSGVDKGASFSDPTEDQDGWARFARGEEVEVRRLR